jgi:hypothetical protein
MKKKSFSVEQMVALLKQADLVAWRQERVVLTDLLGNGRLASSPVSTRLAAYSLQPKPAED